MAQLDDGNGMWESNYSIRVASLSHEHEQFINEGNRSLMCKPTCNKPYFDLIRVLPTAVLFFKFWKVAPLFYLIGAILATEGGRAFSSLQACLNSSVTNHVCRVSLVSSKNAPLSSRVPSAWLRLYLIGVVLVCTLAILYGPWLAPPEIET